MKRGLPTAILAATLMSNSVSAAPVDGRYQTLGKGACRMLDFAPRSDPDEGGGDFVLYRCGGVESVPIWMLYQDSSHLGIGFGSRRNTHGHFGIDRNGRWPLEWRGATSGGRFRPFAVILRVGVYDGGKDGFRPRLVVFALTRDGSGSCLIGEARDGVQARAMADAVAERRCG
ncbi:MAG: hypothetical protein JSR45_07540 [Proteobacteria bacterium]|nr:hypothetical protein [Pseudomonadota bacterium]